MGTSFSQPSPNTSNWLAVEATYQDDLFSIDRVVQEVWIAARNPEEGDWTNRLKSPEVVACFAAAQQHDSPTIAVGEVSRTISNEKWSSLAADIGKRALVQSYEDTNRSQRFVESLFAETTAYLVARDLAGFIGEGYRNQTASAAISFTILVRDHVVSATRRASANLPLDQGAWESQVDAVVSSLTE